MLVFVQYSDFNSRLNLSSSTESIFKKFDLELSGSREFPTQTVNVFSYNKMFFVGGLIKMNFGKKKISLHHWNVIFFSSIFLLQVKILSLTALLDIYFLLQIILG